MTTSFGVRSLLPLAAVLVILASPGALRADDGDPLAWAFHAFDDGTLATDTGTAIAVRPDGRVLQFGTVDFGSGGHRMAITQYLPNGAPDPSFSGDGELVDPFGLGVDSWGTAIVLLPSGDAIVGGTVDHGGGNHDFLIGKIESTGIPHELFGASGEGYTVESVSSGGDSTDDLAAIAVDRFGRIVMVGTSDGGPTDLEIGVARLIPNGVWDDSFYGNGNRLIGLAAVGGPDHGLGVAVDRSDRIVIAAATWDVGSGSDYDVAIVALEPDGDLDPTFDGDGIVRVAYDVGGTKNDFPRAVAVHPDREIVVAGDVATAADRTAWFLLSIPAGGGDSNELLGAFCGTLASPCTDGPQESGRALLLQGDGKVVLGGSSSGADGTGDLGLARFDRALTPDPSFSGDGKATYDFGYGIGAGLDQGLALAFDRDGRVVLGGSAEYDGADTDYAWARVESSYVFGDGFDGPGGFAPWSSKVP